MPYFTDVADAIARDVDLLRATGALAARPGRALDADGYPTKRRAVVLLRHPDAPLRDVPASVGGFPVDVRDASAAQVAQFAEPAFLARASISRPETVPSDVPGQIVLTEFGADALAAAPSEPYAPPPGANYDPIVLPNVTMICSVSPDNGWSVLESFLRGTRRALATAMYDFTSAHVLQTVATALAGKSFELVLDDPSKNPTADQTDPETVAALAKALAAGFEQQWALTPSDPDGATPIFQSAYHIKVAVRDAGDADGTVWISSGNWNDSNQPIFDWQHPDAALAAKSDRDWHVVVLDPTLAARFEQFVDWDFQVARTANGAAGGARTLPAPLPEPRAATTDGFTTFVGPATIRDAMTITPLFTPDAGVYVGAIAKLFDGATKTIDLQLQYVTSFAVDAAFDGLIASLASAQKRGVAVRMIFSEYQQAAILELMAEAGLAVDRDHVRIQNNVHNKGMLVDGAFTVVSSQNWSGAGVLRNRDAGVIIENAQVNAYFQARFDYDWANLATAKPAPPQRSPAPGGDG